VEPQNTPSTKSALSAAKRRRTSTDHR